MNNRIAFDSRTLRKSLGLTQLDFWSQVGVGPIVGSRYEQRLILPGKIAALVKMVHCEQIDVVRIKRADWEIIEYLREHDLALLSQLKAAVRAKLRIARPPVKAKAKAPSVRRAAAGAKPRPETQPAA